MPIIDDPFAPGAPYYEAWYDTPAGSRADALEKGLLSHLLHLAFADAASALEIGCGTGHFARWLEQQGLSVVGLDRSAAMLAEGRPESKVPLLQGDAHQLPFADHAFDVVVLITTLEFVADPVHVLCEALRVARQGVLLGVLNRYSLLGLQRRLAERSQRTVYSAARFYGVSELRRLVGLAVGARAQVTWRTTLFPRLCPWHEAPLPGGGLIGMAVRRPARQEPGAP
ncbi:MAG: class I SAM-dependent methyltransferase [Anaerolineae bacterium]|jgi:ubiquinone/menaquinone biosynthesis C-methylase UbiE